MEKEGGKKKRRKGLKGKGKTGRGVNIDITKRQGKLMPLSGGVSERRKKKPRLYERSSGPS